MADAKKVPEEKTEKKQGKFQWFIFVIFIPLVFAITLALIVLTVAGQNVFDLAKKYGSHIPYVSQFIPGTDGNQSKTLKQEVAELKITITEKENKIKELETTGTTKDEEIKKLQTEIEELKKKASEVEGTSTNSSSSGKTPSKTISITDVLGNIDAKKAAAIIPQLSDAIALDILSGLKSVQVAEIFSSMQPADAAKYTELLLNKEKSPKNP